MGFTSKQIIEFVKSNENRQRVADDSDRFIVYNGKLREVIARAIRSEFEKPETMAQLFDRIIPLNIVQKIINKLAGLYIQSPTRRAVDGNPADEELLDLYSKSMQMNRNGKRANRYFKLHKHTLWEPYLDSNGIPKLRTLPSQTYTPISTDPIEPDKPTIIVKHMNNETEPERQRFAIWDAETFQIVDGGGNLVKSEMEALGNPEGVNPYGRLPFVYVSENDDGNLLPISDDDLITLQVTICVLLTDLAFASKYQLWSVIVAKGMGSSESFDWNPNSIISLPPGVEIDAIKPQLDTQEALLFIETLVSMLLTTKNLSVGDISGQISARNAASGVAKLLDRAETTEDRLDQEQVFREAETELWDLFAHSMLPVWVDAGMVNPEFVGRFSDDFLLSITFADPKPPVGDKEKVELEQMKLDSGFTTRTRALQEIHPEMDNEEIEQLDEEIEAEKKEKIQTTARLFQQASSTEEAQAQVDDGTEA